MASSNNNLVRMSLMGALNHPGDAVALLSDETWLQSHVRGDDRLLVDVLAAARQRGGIGTRPIASDEAFHKALLDLAKWLDRAQCDVWAMNDHGRDAFDLAVSCGCAGLVEWLGQHPRRPQNIARKWDDRTELPMVSNPGTIKALARLGFDPNKVDGGGNTALHLAGDAATAQALMDAGADPSLKNRSGRDVRASWDLMRVATGEERKAMEVVLARFEKPDADRVIEEFSAVVQKQGISQAMHRLELGGVDIATARWKGFTLPEMMVARALNHGLSGAPIMGSASVKDVSAWAKRCVSVMGHYQKKGGQVDDGIVSAFSILQRVVENAKHHCGDLHSELPKAHNESYTRQLRKREEQIMTFVPPERRHMVAEDCKYLDRAVEEGLIEVGSAVAGNLAMEARHTQFESEPGAVDLVERSLREHWDGKWNAYPRQVRGAVMPARARLHMIGTVAQILRNDPRERDARTAVMLLGIMAAHTVNTTSDIASGRALLNMIEGIDRKRGDLADVQNDEFVTGCLDLVLGVDRARGQQILGQEQFDEMCEIARKLQAKLTQDHMQQSTPQVKSGVRSMGRI